MNFQQPVYFNRIKFEITMVNDTEIFWIWVLFWEKCCVFVNIFTNKMNFNINFCLFLRKHRNQSNLKKIIFLFSYTDIMVQQIILYVYKGGNLCRFQDRIELIHEIRSLSTNTHNNNIIALYRAHDINLWV